MDLGLTDDQVMLVESVTGLLARESPPDVVRGAEPIGHDPGVWDALRGNGMVEIAVPQDAGGWGADLVDLCLVAECLGRACAPAPVVETQAAARLLADIGSAGAGLLADMLTGDRFVTLAVRPVVGTTAALVPGGAVADIALVWAEDALTAVHIEPGTAHRPNHGDLPLADVPVADGEVLASGPGARARYERAVDTWLLLTASALVGIGAAALRLAVDYAKERHAFGSPIGAYQGIAHRLADAATLLDGARLLVQEAAWTGDVVRGEFGEGAAMAFGFATDAAKYATYWAVHTHGGYGVMLEYDVHLFFQRARGWAGVFGDADAAYLRVAERRYRRSAR